MTYHCIKINEYNLSIYEQNKREMFDGMRAYHASEHQHKRDAINFMKTILAVTVGAYGAVLGSFITPELKFEYTTLIAWVIFIISVVSTVLVVNSTNRKIEADHKVYEVFGAEYTTLCKILELDQVVDVSGSYAIPKNLDPDNPIGKGEGYKKTMDIISETGWAVLAMSFMLAIMVTFLSNGS